MKKIIICALITCLMLSCFSPAVAKAEESKRIDYSTVSDAVNGKGIGDAGIGVVYRYYIDNELYFEKEVLYCVSYPDGYDYTLGDVFVLQTYDDHRGRIALYGSSVYSNLSVTVYSKTYDYMTELNGEATINTYTEKSCSADATTAVNLADDEIYIFDYEYVNESNETVAVKISDKYAWGFGAYSYYDDSNVLQTSTIRRTAPVGYRVSTDENGYNCFIRASLSFSSNLDADGFESYVRDLIDGEYSAVYPAFGSVVTDNNGCDYKSGFEFYFDCNSPLYLYYIDNNLFAYSDTDFTVVARGYFGDSVVYYYENCEAGRNLIYEYHIDIGNSFETDDFIVEYKANGDFASLAYPPSNGGFYYSETLTDSFSSVGTVFTLVEFPCTYAEFLEIYEADNGDIPIGVTPTPMPTKAPTIDYSGMTAEELCKYGFVPSGVVATAEGSVRSKKATYVISWNDVASSVYGMGTAKIEFKMAVLVGRFDSEDDSNDYTVEIFDIGALLDANEKYKFDLLSFMKKQSSFFSESDLGLRHMFGYENGYGIEYNTDIPYYLENFSYAQILGVFARYHLPDGDNYYSTDWCFFEHATNPKLEFDWLDTSCLSDIGLAPYATFSEMYEFTSEYINYLADYIITVKGAHLINGDTTEQSIDVNQLMTKSVENSLVDVVAMFPQLIYFVSSVPQMFAALFGFLPDPLLKVITFSLCATVTVGIIRMFK